MIRDLPMSGSQVVLRLRYRKGYCPTCGITVEYHEFIEPYATMKPLLKGSRYLLLKNAENLTAKERSRLKELLQRNELLASVYLLKDYLKRL
jgi:hypothetical protein